MHPPAPEYWWAIGIGTVGLLLLTVAFLATLVISQKRLRAQLEATRRNEAKYRNLFDNSLVGMFRLSLAGFLVLDSNKTFLIIFEKTFLDEAVNVFWSIPSHRREVLNATLLRDGMLENEEIELSRNDGTTFWISMTCRLNRSEGYAEGVVLDVTERKHAEERLRDSHQQLRNLSARLDSVREEERIRIARQVHDELGQILTAVKIHLTVLTDAAMARDSRGKSSLQKKLEALITVIDNAIDLVKNISYELRPLALEELGLKEAVEWEASQFGQRTGIQCRMQTSGDIVLDREQSTAVFRIFQEALTNVVRHASAKTVFVQLSATDETMSLEVADDGKGITDQQLADSRALGILGMRERAMFLGGSLQVSRNNGKGTVVGLTVPLKKNGNGQGA
ncbi:MAG: PAS domain-containing sensor histidine kinase [Bacteroidota bacterium]